MIRTEKKTHDTSSLKITSQNSPTLGQPLFKRRVTMKKTLGMKIWECVLFVERQIEGCVEEQRRGGWDSGLGSCIDCYAHPDTRECIRKFFEERGMEVLTPFGRCFSARSIRAKAIDLLYVAYGPDLLNRLQRELSKLHEDC
jgi:hypothetical protein